MRILALNWRDPRHPEAGGAEVHLWEILTRWVARGASVTCVATRFPGAAAEETIDGIRVLRRGSWWNGNWAAAACVTRELRGQPFDLVVEDLNKLPYYSPLYAPAPVLVIVPHLFGTTVFAEASAPMAAAVWAHERLVPALYGRAPFLAISESTRRDLVARGIPRARIAVSHCGLDHDRYRPTAPKTAAPTVAFVGRLRRYKGVDTLLEAYRRLVPRVPGVRLVVLGDGPHRPALEARARRLGLDGIEFTGYVPAEEKVRRMSAAWVSALPSPKEGWGLTVVESNACGTPVVASRSPGLIDSVRDGVSGLLVPHGDAPALAAALERVLTDAPLRERLREGGMAWAARFRWDRTADEAWSVAEAVARGRPVPDPSAAEAESVSAGGPRSDPRAEGETSAAPRTA